MTENVPTEQLLFETKDEELQSLLGLTTLPLTASPAELLEAGRRGEFWQASGPESQGGEVFDFTALREFGRRFLRAWRKRLVEAICTNQDVQKSANQEITVLAAVAAAALTSHIPELLPYAGAISILAAIVARSGVQGFCDELQKA